MKKSAQQPPQFSKEKMLDSEAGDVFSDDYDLEKDISPL